VAAASDALLAPAWPQRLGNRTGCPLRLMTMVDDVAGRSAPIADVAVWRRAPKCRRIRATITGGQHW
jgi:hypothetical protein